MIQVTSENLKKIREEVIKERDAAFVTLHRSDGILSFLDHMEKTCSVEQGEKDKV